MTLSRLLYVSRCKSAKTGADRIAEVRDIASKSASRNATADLSGVLLHVGDSFVQVLEGPGTSIERVFERICCDFRHEDVKLIDLVPVKERVFAEWGMAVLCPEEDTAIRLRDDLEEVRFLVGINAREAVNQMRRLLDGR